jgi:hypothetical protein
MRSVGVDTTDSSEIDYQRKKHVLIFDFSNAGLSHRLLAMLYCFARGNGLAFKHLEYKENLVDFELKVGENADAS